MVVAWIQRETTKGIINAAQANLREITALTPSSWGSIKGGFIRR
jgi:hypothetical protein